jgi:hypothetical protein
VTKVFPSGDPEAFDQSFREPRSSLLRIPFAEMQRELTVAADPVDPAISKTSATFYGHSRIHWAHVQITLFVKLYEETIYLTDSNHGASAHQKNEYATAFIEQ